MTNFEQKSDVELLQSFCVDGAAGAFDALVQRYAGMVCGVANRVTGRRELAEEAAQNVFAQLANKARSLIGRSGRLAGWLHRAAVFEAKHLLRGERRHERRVKEAGERQGIEAATGGGDEALRAEIDNALNSLPRSDREVLVWRYYSGLNYREIAERAGKSEAAAQKQGRRALEKLGSRLRGAGVSVSAAALATFFGVGMTEAVPTGVAAGWSAAAVVGKSGAAVFPVVGIGKAVVGAGVAAALLATIVYQGRLIAEERNQIGASRSGDGDSRPQPSALVTRDFMADVSFRGAGDVDLARLAEDLYRGKHLYDRERGFRAMATLESIARLPGEEQRALFERGATSGLPQQRREELLVQLAPLVGEHEPAWLMNYCFPGPGEDRERLWLTNEVVPWPGPVLGTVAKRWAEREPEVALAWVALALGENRFGSPDDGANEAALAEIAASVGAHAWSNAQAEVERMLLKLPRGCRTEAVGGLISQIEDDVGLAALAGSATVARERLKENRFLGAIGSKWTERNWDEVEALAARFESEHVRREVLLGAANKRWRFGDEIGQSLDEMLGWIDQNVAQADMHHLRGSLLGRLDYKESDDVNAALARFAADPEHGQTVLGAYLVHAIGPGNPVDVLRRGAAELQDPGLRVELGYRAAVYMDERRFRDQEIRGVGFSQGEIDAMRRRFMR